MNLKNTLLLAALSLLMSALTVQAGPAYTIVDLGTLGGNTQAQAINSTGEVVGVSNLPNGNSRAFLYEKGVMHDIGFLGTNKNDDSVANAINDLGVVVGFSYIDPTLGNTHAFLFDGHMHDLGTLGGNYGSATGINDLGQVVGTSTTKNSVYHAFVYSNGRMTDLGVLGGNYFSNSGAYGINKIGEIVGSSTYNNDPITVIPNGPDLPGFHAFLYAYDHMYDLGINPGFENLNSVATAINDHGQIVGNTQNIQGIVTGADVVFGFVYSGGVVTKINNIMEQPGPTYFTGVGPEAINNSGVVVGTDPRAPLATEFGTGFIYRGGVMLNANTLIPADSGWAIGRCTGINDNGQICGWGQHNGLFRAFVMTPVGSPLLP